MVYGLNVQPEYGYFTAVEPLNGDVSKVRATDLTDDGGVNYGGAWGGRAVDGSNFPTKAQWKDPNGNPVPDFDVGVSLNVSERAKRVIEEVEPNVHQFFPVEFVDAKGKLLENRYWLVVNNRIDSLDRERTTLVLDQDRAWVSAKDLVRWGEEVPRHIDPEAPPRAVFNLSQIGDAHLWHDKHIRFRGAYISDEMAQAFKAARLAGLRLDDSKSEAV